MIAYRVEIWCNGVGEGRKRKYCSAGSQGRGAGVGDGTAHDDLNSLPRLGQNLEGIYLKQGWTKIGDKHFCPKCSAAMKKSGGKNAKGQ